MTAADFVTAAGVSLEALGQALPRVDPGRVAVRRAPRWFSALWTSGIGAMTLPWAIYLRQDPLTLSPAEWGGLMVHELTHLEQWRREGLLGFISRYLSDYLGHRLRGKKHGEAYLAIRFEEEAERVRAGLIV